MCGSMNKQWQEINMNDLAGVVQETLASYYEEIGQRVHEWVDPLTTEQLWVGGF